MYYTCFVQIFFRNLTQWKYLLIHVCKSLVMNYPCVYEEGGKIVSLLNLTITIIPMTHFSNIIILNVSKKIFRNEPSQAWFILKSTKSFMYKPYFKLFLTLIHYCFKFVASLNIRTCTDVCPIMFDWVRWTLDCHLQTHNALKNISYCCEKQLIVFAWYNLNRICAFHYLFINDKISPPL